MAIELLDLPLELGDVPGHEFYENQHTGAGGRSTDGGSKSGKTPKEKGDISAKEMGRRADRLGHKAFDAATHRGAAGAHEVAAAQHRLEGNMARAGFHDRMAEVHHNVASQLEGKQKPDSSKPVKGERLNKTTDKIIAQNNAHRDAMAMVTEKHALAPDEQRNVKTYLKDGSSAAYDKLSPVEQAAADDAEKHIAKMKETMNSAGPRDTGMRGSGAGGKATQQKFKISKGSRPIGLAFDLADVSPWVCSDETNKLYRKKILKVGNFEKSTDGIKFDVTPRSLDHLVNTFKEMRANGVRVPLPMGHTTDESKNKGWVVDMEHDGESLWATIQFTVDNAEELTKSNDVSVYIPHEKKDGQGRLYHRPITHVALTPYPVIPGLGDFQAVAASFVKESSMDWSKLQKALGISTVMTDENAVGLIAEAFEKAKTPVATTPISASQPPAVINIVKDNRRMRLDSLVTAGKLSPAVRDELIVAFNADKAIALSFDTPDADNFDLVVKALEKNEPLKAGVKSGIQLSDPLKTGNTGETSPLVEDAKRRAAAASKQVRTFPLSSLLRT